jgi:hypothetical protein
MPYDLGIPGGRPPKHKAPPFGERLAASRLAKGLSQVQLAKKLWCDPAGHPGDDLAPGTLNSVLKQAGLKENN